MKLNLDILNHDFIMKNLFFRVYVTLYRKKRRKENRCFFLFCLLLVSLLYLYTYIFSSRDDYDQKNKEKNFP